MDVFSFITLFGGLAFFLYGMHTMSAGLEKMAGGKLEKTLKKMTSTRFKSLLLGAGITIAIQSSSAMTVMLVGLVNSGIMVLSQTVGVIMGSNIGTTLTAWLLSLTGVESSNVFIRLLKPESFAPIMALIGIVLIMIAKKPKKKDIGNILVGFSILMYGMTLMSGSVSPLADMPEFSSILTAFTNPLLGVLVGAVVTGVIQSSAASVGILQALSLTGSVTYGMAIPIIMGQNIGTCVTSVISSIGVNKNAKRVAALHICFNLIGTVFFLIIYYLAGSFTTLAFLDSAVSPAGVALSHSVFNVATTMLLLPFSNKLVKLAEVLVRDRDTVETYTFIDERLLNTPSFAISECNNMAVNMSFLAKKTILKAISLLQNYTQKEADTVLKWEDELDKYEDKLGSFLVKLSSRDLSDADSREISKLLHTIGDFERLGDHAVNLLKVAAELNEKGIDFSNEAKSELKVLITALTDILELTANAFENADLSLAARVEPLEQVIDSLTATMKSRHIERLQNGICTIELGFILSDLLSNCERVSDHCSNIAVALIEVAQNSFDTHEYLNSVKTMDNQKFREAYNDYQLKYHL